MTFGLLPPARRDPLPKALRTTHVCKGFHHKGKYEKMKKHSKIPRRTKRVLHFRGFGKGFLKNPTPDLCSEVGKASKEQKIIKLGVCFENSVTVDDDRYRRRLVATTGGD